MTETQTLSAEFQELALNYELHYLRHGALPTAKDLDTLQTTLDRFLSFKPIRDYLINERNVPLDKPTKLTAKQLDWINCITDPTDQRPLTKKLSELDIKMSQVRAWNNNPFYAKVLYERTNKAFGNNRHAVLRSLQLEAMAGNISAIKLYLELTGDVEATNNSGQTTTINNNTVTLEARSLLNNILEILQRHLQPELLHIIVDELEQVVANPSKAPQLPALPAPTDRQRVAAALEVRPYTPKPSSIKQVVEDNSDWLS